MKILILGDPNAYFRMEFSKNMQKHLKDIQIDIISNIEYSKKQNVYNNIFLLKFSKSKNALQKFISLRREMNQIAKYDIIHVHSVSLLWLLCIDILKRKGNKLILTYYGSDFFKIKKNYYFLFRLFNFFSDFVVFTSKAMKEIVTRKSKNNKFTIIPFGISSFSEIDNLRSVGKDEIKSQFGIKKTDLVITVGYNCQKEQNHIKVLDIMEKIKNCNKEFVVILPMNYGNQDYLNKVRNMIDNYSFKIMISDKFLDDKELAKLRFLSDIMIHVQDSDQFSASVAEYLYSENILINGEWIKYDEYEKLGIYYEKIFTIDELESKILEIINNFDSLKTRINAPKLMREKFSWENTCMQYNKLYLNNNAKRNVTNL